MELTPENAQFATATLTAFTKAVNEATEAVERLEAALERVDAKMHEISESPVRCVINFETPKGKRL